MAATAKPDGYTIAQMPITVFRLPYMTKTTFDPTKDFTYIAGLTGYTFGVVVNSKIAVEDLQGAGRVRQGQPRQDQVRHARHRHQPAHRHGADRQADRREVDAGALQGRAPRPTRRCSAATSMPVADSTGWGALVNSGDFRLLVTWGAEPHQELAGCADPAGARHQAGRQLALRHRRPQGHGPARSSRCCTTPSPRA